MHVRTREASVLIVSLASTLLAPPAMAQDPDTDSVDSPMELVELGVEEQSAALLAAFQGERHRLVRASLTPDPLQTRSDGSVLLTARIDAGWDELAVEDLIQRLSAPAMHTGEVPVTVRLPGGRLLELHLHAELLPSFERLVERALSPTARLVALDSDQKRLGISEALVALSPHRLGLHGLDLARPPRQQVWRPTALEYRTDAGWALVDEPQLSVLLDLPQASALARVDVLRGNDPDFLARIATARRARIGAALATAGQLPDPALGLERGLAEGALSVARCGLAEELARPLALQDASEDHLTLLARTLACQGRWAESSDLLGQAGKALASADAQRHLGVLELQVSGPTDDVALHAAGWAPPAEREEGVVRWRGLDPGLYRVTLPQKPGWVTDGDQVLEVTAGQVTRSRLELRELPPIEGSFVAPTFDSALHVMVGDPALPLTSGATLDARSGPLPVEVSLPDWQVYGAPIWVRELPQLAAPEDLALPAAIAVEADRFDVFATVGSQRFRVPAGQSRAVLAVVDETPQLPVVLEIEGYGAFSGALDVAAGRLSRMQVRPHALPAFQAEQRAERARTVAVLSAISTGALVALSVGMGALAGDRWSAAQDAAATAEGAGPGDATRYYDAIAEAEQATTWSNIWIGGSVLAGAGAVFTGATFALPGTLRYLRKKEEAERARAETLPLDGVVVESP